MKALESDDPVFQLYTFRADLQVVKLGQIKAGEPYLSYEGLWCVNRMTDSGSSRVVGRHTTFNAAFFEAKKLR